MSEEREAPGPMASSSAGLGVEVGQEEAPGGAGPARLLSLPSDTDGPPKKRLRAETEPGSVRLEERLYSVLCCTVCLDLPKASVYQCTNGHLMCAGCFIHLLADARLKEEQATCPNCRCEISKSLCCRNLAVEKAVSELPSECGFCLKQFPRSLLERHKKDECQDRVTQCKYKRIGCPWQGPFHELTVHESECCHPTKTGNELMEILDEMDQTHKKEMQLYNSIFSLLSFEKIGYTGKASAPRWLNTHGYRLSLGLSLVCGRSCYTMCNCSLRISLLCFLGTSKDLIISLRKSVHQKSLLTLWVVKPSCPIWLY